MHLQCPCMIFLNASHYVAAGFVRGSMLFLLFSTDLLFAQNVPIVNPVALAFKRTVRIVMRTLSDNFAWKDRIPKWIWRHDYKRADWVTDGDKETCVRLRRVQGLDVSGIQHLSRHFNCKQQDNESSSDYTRHFKTLREILHSHLGGPILVPKALEEIHPADVQDEENDEYSLDILCS